MANLSNLIRKDFDMRESSVHVLHSCNKSLLIPSTTRLCVWTAEFKLFDFEWLLFIVTVNKTLELSFGFIKTNLVISVL